MKYLLALVLGLSLLFPVGLPQVDAGENRGPDGRLKVLYHIDGADLKTACGEEVNLRDLGLQTG